MRAPNSNAPWEKINEAHRRNRTGPRAGGLSPRCAQTEKTITPVRVTAIEMYQPRAGGRYSATIMPGRQVNLAFRVSGIVTATHRVGGRSLEPGDIVAG